MRSCVDFLNKKRLFEFDFDKVMQLNEWCVKTYYSNCQKLYDLGYLSVPSDFDTADFLNCIDEEDLQALLNQTTGKINLEYKTIACLLKLNKFTDSNVFTYVAELLYALEINSVLCDLNSNGKEKCPTGICKKTINLKISDQLRINKGTDYFNFEILKCLKHEEGKDLYTAFDLRGVYFEKIAEYIGIDKGTYKHEYVDKNKSLMFKNLTYEDDLQLFDVYISCHVVGDTDEAKKFKEFVMKYYKKMGEDTSKNKEDVTFFDKLYRDCGYKLEKFVTDTRNELKDMGLFIEDRSITPEYYSCWLNDVLYSTYKPLIECKNNFSIGVYFFNHTKKEYDIQLKARLNGFMGEFIYPKNKRNYTKVGFPIIIDDEPYYPMYNIIGEYPKCERIQGYNLAKPNNLSSLSVREVEILSILRKIDTDTYTVENLEMAFNRVNSWIKNLTTDEKEEMFKKIIEVYTNTGV